MNRFVFIMLLTLLSTGVSAANENNVLVGDMDADGRITKADVSALTRVVLGERKAKFIPAKYVIVNADTPVTETEHRHFLGDVDGDGCITIADVTILIDMMTGKKAKQYILPDVVYDTLGIRNGHEYVDLGLSVKWATCNVGTESSFDYGKYFAWGETVAKQKYDWATYEWVLPGESTGEYINKYTFQDYMLWSLWYDDYGDYVGDNKIALDMQDDVVSEIWGEDWRMPSFDELLELKNNCTWVWTSNYKSSGLKGYIVTSKKSGFTNKSIFLPASGTMRGKTLSNTGTYGTYWTRNLAESSSYCACGLGFNSSSIYWFDSDRCYGMSIRPVIP